ncbi:hypothetical protein PPERSA_03727 [Pseudocohnilembus persalinus]|uniref:Uncharacterized protein n=1 Tax=Pseudocohnilembus persalinus TaxID=266149 RepID=A0A0V0QHJ8_PSEPJ|nr:hypothetical protein PPERSA_03727 [Pseudocohnilembus persalinus]|eukprot:KRX01643.1 hypothetical protein PPERSA_03727 [Pseudocohnilembus persalinus]
MSQEQEQYYNNQNQLQQSQEEQDDIPDYKQEFLTTLQKEYEEKQRQQQNSQYNSQFNSSKSFNLPSLNKVTNTNDVWNSSQYSSANWRQNLTTSHYNTQHNEKQHILNAQLNPEVKNKRNNMRVTQISEYSNALHNNR